MYLLLVVQILKNTMMGKKIISAPLSLVGDVIILHPEAESYTHGQATIACSLQTTDDFTFPKNIIFYTYLIHNAENKNL